MLSFFDDFNYKHPEFINPCYKKDITDDGNIKLEVQLPGLSRDDIKVFVEGETLNVQWGKNPTECYAFRISADVQIGGIEAEMKNGMLYLFLPRTNKKIQIHVR